MKHNYRILLLLLFCSHLLISNLLYARDPLPPSRFEKLTGKKVKVTSSELWNQKYAGPGQAYLYGKHPEEFLVQSYAYLPAGGSVLDMGMGEGRNAVFLAQKGFRVTGIDISSVAIEKAKTLAQEKGVKINTIMGSFYDHPFQPQSFDAIICFYFVDKKLIPKMLNWLKPKGIIIFESFTTDQLKRKDFQAADYRSEDFLAPQQLLKLFGSVRILKFEEPLHSSEKFRSSILLQKP